MIPCDPYAAVDRPHFLRGLAEALQGATGVRHVTVVFPPTLATARTRVSVELYASGIPLEIRGRLARLAQTYSFVTDVLAAPDHVVLIDGGRLVIPL